MVAQLTFRSQPAQNNRLPWRVLALQASRYLRYDLSVVKKLTADKTVTKAARLAEQAAKNVATAHKLQESAEAIHEKAERLHRKIRSQG